MLHGTLRAALIPRGAASRVTKLCVKRGTAAHGRRKITLRRVGRAVVRWHRQLPARGARPPRATAQGQFLPAEKAWSAPAAAPGRTLDRRRRKCSGRRPPAGPETVALAIRHHGGKSRSRSNPRQPHQAPVACPPRQSRGSGETGRRPGGGRSAPAIHPVYAPNRSCESPIFARQGTEMPLLHAMKNR